MKNLIRKISYPLLILIILTGILIYFIVSVCLINAESERLRAQIRQQEILRTEAENRGISYSPEEQEYFSLKTQLNQSINSKNDEDDGIKKFLSDYDKAMDYDVDNIDSFKEKQRFIKERMSVFFKDTEFQKTDDYHLTVLPETFTTPVRDAFGVIPNEYAEGKNTISWQRRDIVSAYIGEAEKDKTDLILKVENYNKSYWEYQKISIATQNNSYQIVSFELLNI